jgi:large subunit ribosomal protein L22
MEGKAQARFCRGSARKMRRVAALVKGMPVDRAAAVLRALPKAAATPLAKTIASATANALAIEGTAHHKSSDFVISELSVDGGPIARRFRATGMGRAYRIRKRYCHVRVVVSDEAVPIQAHPATKTASVKKAEPVKPAEAEKKAKAGKPAEKKASEKKS